LSAVAEYDSGLAEVSHLRSDRAEKRPIAKPTLEEETPGFCIGCGDPSQPLNPDRPFCTSCYGKSGGGDLCDDLPQRVCHHCGEEHRATLEKPFCWSCWKRHYE
ncbi:MAG: hypothetical protein ACYSX0_16985, partial [Planctomycetota bacterium]